jgi:methylmalonyl-CoA/ethylmalonyl-CoA epimerase
VQLPQRLHHIGFVIASIEASAASFIQTLGANWTGEIFHDPIQKVKVAFFSTPASDAQIELVEPAGADAPVRTFLEKGGGLHHLCYEVEDCEAALRGVREQRGLIVKRPNPAVAFGGRRIAWALTAEKLLLEFLETSLR